MSINGVIVTAPVSLYPQVAGELLPAWEASGVPLPRRVVVEEVAPGVIAVQAERDGYVVEHRCTVKQLAEMIAAWPTLGDTLARAHALRGAGDWNPVPRYSWRLERR